MRLLALLLLVPDFLPAIQHSGSVRAADQFIPGAAVTARQGGAKVVAYTDEAGRYTLDLTPGMWEIEVEMFGFRRATQRLEITNDPSSIDWTLEMPRAGDKAPTQVVPAPVATARAPRGAPGAGRGGRGASQNPGFQNVNVQATEQGAREANTTPPVEDAASGDTGDSFLVRGSDSGGLADAADEQVRRDRVAGRGGLGPGGAGRGGAGSLSDMAALGAGAQFGGDALGLNGFGAAGVQNGFGDGLGGAGGGRGGPGGGGGGGGGRGGGGRNQPGRGQQAGRGARGGRGPNNGAFSAFGNRRRNQPQYTGSVSLTARNSVLDAKPFSLNGQNAAKSSYAQNNFSMQLGGPLRIPKVGGWDRSQFFFTWQGNRSRNPFNQVSTMPSTLERTGDFSRSLVAGAPVTIYDPLTQSPFPGNVIPANRINPASAGLLTFLPLPTYTQLLVQNYQIVTSSKNSSDNFGTRFNLPLSRKDRVNFNVNYQSRNGSNPTLLGYRDTSEGSGLNAQAGWSHSFASRFNSNLSWNLSRNISKGVPYFAYTSNVAGDLGITGTTQEPIAYGPPNLSFTNFGGLSDGSASVNRNQTTNITENLTLVIRRKHNLTFGVGYRRLQQNPLNYANARGSFSFSGLLTSGLDANGNPIRNTGYDFADFLLGLPQSSSLQFGAKSNYFRSWSLNGFVQDDFRARPNLSINIGLRYEYFSPYTELFGRMANLDLNSTITALAVVTPGMSGLYAGDLPTSLVRADTNNFSPRFGFAWKPNAKKPLTLRGGYSIFFNGSAYGNFASKMAAQPPFVHTASLTTSAENRLTLENGFAASPSQTVTNNYAIDPNYRLGYAQTWTFALQESLPHNTIVELEYIGTKGTALDILRQPNRATPGSPLTAAERLQIGNATGFTYETSQGSSIMHMGQIRITRRLTRGISSTATYGFQKSIDNASSFGGGGGVIAQNDQDLHLERGLSSFDQRHHLNVQYQLTSPVGGARGFLRGRTTTRKLLQGWTLNGGFNATSGTPLTARVSGNLANTGGTAAFGSGRAQATGLPIDGGTYFNLAAFTLPLAGEYGNAGRNTIPGLFQTSLNASFGRSFRIADTRRQVTIRLNTTNAFNHITITNIGTTVNSSTWGLPTGASQTRTVSLNLRFNY
jgi:hypothetical protein